jgi:hypothetical protein
MLSAVTAGSSTATSTSSPLYPNVLAAAAQQQRQSNPKLSSIDTSHQAPPMKVSSFIRYLLRFVMIVKRYYYSFIRAFCMQKPTSNSKNKEGGSRKKATLNVNIIQFLSFIHSLIAFIGVAKIL